MGDSARTAILERIRAANAPHMDGLAVAQAAWRLIPREYRRSATLDRAGILELLVDRLRDYDAQVERVSPAGAAAAVKRTLEAFGNGPLLVAAGFPAELLPRDGSFAMDDGFSHAELDRFAGVLTGATLAIAETGTLVLQNVPGQGRRAATLVPDFHICVLRAEDVVETVPEAIERLSSTVRLPTTFVSGPSATADIEMTRIKGVHGPRFLHVVLIDSVTE
jgi:L-lactate dehydrogenase complex protein LldG